MSDLSHFSAISAESVLVTLLAREDCLQEGGRSLVRIIGTAGQDSLAGASSIIRSVGIIEWQRIKTGPIATPSPHYWQEPKPKQGRKNRHFSNNT